MASSRKVLPLPAASKRCCAYFAGIKSGRAWLFTTYRKASFKVAQVYNLLPCVLVPVLATFKAMLSHLLPGVLYSNGLCKYVTYKSSMAGYVLLCHCFYVNNVCFYGAFVPCCYCDCL
ncbi:hypothetical protein NPIL_247111 [Nephila pilipes]|uniref:Uncharacterized protein n=1 Tax=Nephila pilipes TaxID=299642 RepID=A0A8X6PJV1_NEPPI|nr:hypothetical protein NPIL_247111 [Nephila pilipes]